MSTLKPLAPDTLDKLRYASTATITMQLLKRGLRHGAIKGARPLDPAHARCVGPAYTLRFIPMREDLAGPPKPGTMLPHRMAVEHAPAGSVLVIDAGGAANCGTLGDILVARLKHRGVAGVVSDGPLRDLAGVVSVGFPVLSVGSVAPASMNEVMPIDVDLPIGCGGVAVFPGDVISTDMDGAVVIPRHLADEVARDSYEQERLEKFVLSEVKRGRSIDGLYPPDDKAMADYRQWQARGEGN
ncbi:MAG: ribonuclease activity regulator RraA [Alphaproteobacteria bacterium]|nr:ribonuclease activity regulator RraA [Alphaproteobacteria bacterium]